MCDTFVKKWGPREIHHACPPPRPRSLSPPPDPLPTILHFVRIVRRRSTLQKKTSSSETKVSSASRNPPASAQASIFYLSLLQTPSLPERSATKMKLPALRALPVIRQPPPKPRPVAPSPSDSLSPRTLRDENETPNAEGASRHTFPPLSLKLPLSQNAPRR